MNETMYKVGEKLFVRTVTYHYVGEITFMSSEELVLKDASWVADSGRFGAALSKGTLQEVEPYPEGVSIARGSIVDASPWKHDLPREAK